MPPRGMGSQQEVSPMEDREMCRGLRRSRGGLCWAELPQVVLQSGACRLRGARRIEVWLKRLRISSANGVGKHRDCRSPCKSSELSIELRTKPSLGRRHPLSTLLFDGSRTPRTARGCGW